MTAWSARRAGQGQALPRMGAEYAQRIVRYQAPATVCNACPAKAAPTPSRRRGLGLTDLARAAVRAALRGLARRPAPPRR